MTDDEAAALSLAAAAAVDFRNGTTEHLQRPAKNYAEMLSLLQQSLPEKGEAAEQVIADLLTKAPQGLMMATGPRFFGWVIGGSHPVGVAADWLVSAWGQNTANHHAAPAGAAVETVAAGWLLELLDLPRESSVGFATGATAANLIGLAAARGEVLRQHGWDADADGLFGAPAITVMIGDDAHSTVFAALQVLGLGRNRVIRLATDEQGRIDAPAFEQALAKVDGPLIVVLQAGQINTGNFDNFSQLIPLAKQKSAWVHVDGAFGLWARATSHKRELAQGIELADSWATDGHKWLQTPFDSGFAIVKNELAHRRAFTIAASYLPQLLEGERDPSHYVPELSRRARGFATWAIIRHLGRAGIAAMVERHCAVASRMGELLRAEPGIAVVNDVVLNQLIVRFGNNDELTLQTIARIQRDGECFAGGALWRGQQVMRLSVIGWETTIAEGERAAQAIIRAWQRVHQSSA